MQGRFTLALLLAFVSGLLGSVTANGSEVEAEVKSGVVLGTRTGSVHVFKGIPFAKPPVGDLRWRPPQPTTPWRPTRLAAKEFRHNCLQDPSAAFMGWPQPLSTLSEDCLYLNVYAPAKSESNAPVMFWIYGGGFVGGGGNETRLNGTWDVALSGGDLTVVTSNYRLGAFGFLAADELRERDPAYGTGNYAILDQRMALEWVRDNIGAFGSDHKRVFIVGQSAGANSVSQHLVRPKSWGLFSSAGMESGAFYNGRDEPHVEDQRKSYLDFVARVGCSPGNVTCLLWAPALELLKASMAVNNWEPVVDGVDLVMPGSVLAMGGKLAPVPVLAGSVSEDGMGDGIPQPPCDPTNCTEADFSSWAASAWGFDKEQIKTFAKAYRHEEGTASWRYWKYSRWYWLMEHAGADQWSGCPARRTASWATRAGQKAYYYRWSYAPRGKNGAFPSLAHHACEQPFVFHVLSETPQQLADDGGVYHITSSEERLSAAVVGYWRSMAAEGKPDGDVKWPVYDDKQRAGLEIMSHKGRMFKARTNLRGEECDIWDQYFENTRASLKARTIFT